jgi:hypothetical protein
MKATETTLTGHRVVSDAVSGASWHRTCLLMTTPEVDVR